MKRKFLSFRRLAATLGPSLVLAVLAFVVIYKFVDPAPPKHFVISTGTGEGGYQFYAKLYQDIVKKDGVTLEIRPSSGGIENLKRLKDPRSGVDVGFVQDGLGSVERVPGVVSLGSLYYEPIWFFYRGRSEITRLSQLSGKRIALGEHGGGGRILAKRLLAASGVDGKSAKLVELGADEAASALRKGDVDVAVFLGTAVDPMISSLLEDRSLRLVSMDQAEALVRRFPYLHHLVLPHGAVDLARNIPARDTDLVSPTATLVARESLHPALTYLLLKAASQVHDKPGIFEKKDEFPIDKAQAFPLSGVAKQYYKSGAPFWQRYLPFWLATLVDRFLLLVIPSLALIVPLVRLVPRYLTWRINSRIYQRYGELKFLETQIQPGSGAETLRAFFAQLDAIEERVNRMKVPLGHSVHIYGLREHIDFVRQRLRRLQQARETVS